jgi:hypothetical protein
MQRQAASHYDLIGAARAARFASFAILLSEESCEWFGFTLYAHLERPLIAERTIWREK